MIQVEPSSLQERWDSDVLDHGGHPLQLWGWGEVKAEGNWKVERVIVREDDTVIGRSQILYRRLPKPMNALAYIPRGPIALPEKRESVLEALASYARKRRGAVSLMVEPNWEEMPEVPGWRQSPNPILMARTLILDLSLSEEELLSAMSKKTRQYIRKSENEGIEITTAKTLEDIARCLEIYKETAKRAEFALHDDEYYETIFKNLRSHCQVFMATHQGRVVAFLWLAVSAECAFELYGGMSEEGQRLRANYILKWTAIRRCKGWGVRKYDMNGLLNDGVSKFKQGFASHENMLAGSFEKPLSIWYPLWAKGLPAAKKFIRTLKR